MTQPTKWSAPLGSGADVQELPDDDLRYASFSKIFPQITQVPLSAGGVAPRRIDFNSLFKLLADNIYYYQNGGVFEYSATADYEKGAIVRYNDKIYLCIQDNSALNTHNPEDMNYWLRVALINELADYLPLAGGNLTGNLTVQNKNVVRTINDVEADANGNIDIIIPDATTEVKGKVQLCDDIEQNATNKTMAVTPHAVAAYVSAGGKKANDIGIVGRQGFGVSFPDATEDELAAIGMTPMNGTYDKTSDNYGNFMSNNGGVFVYIPHYYVRYGEQTEADYDVYGANVLGVKSHDA